MSGPPRVLSIPVYAYKLGHVVGHQLTSRTKIKLVNVRKWHFHLVEKGDHPLTNMTILSTIHLCWIFHMWNKEEMLCRIEFVTLSLQSTNLELKGIMLCPASLELSEYIRLTNEGGIKEQTNAVRGMGMGRAE